MNTDNPSNVRSTSRGHLVTANAAMRSVLSVLDRVAPSRCTVLVTGESGTGKELAVAALHDASPRAEKPLVAVNCGAIPANLVESELFGHVKGAFTGAMTNRSGLVAAAEGGTLFLDEVGELPLAAQVKLLRLLQSREIVAVGDTKVIKCDVRIVAATNRDLRAEVAAGRFREDLYYRLNVIHVHLPPLRERREDIPLLAEHFLRLAAERSGRSDVVRFAPEALAELAAADWPGNVRGLENAVERAVLLAPGAVVETDCLALETRTPAIRESASSHPTSVARTDDGGAVIDLRAAVDAYENTLIREALRRTGNNKSRAAALLGLQRTTLVEMIKRKQIDGLPRAA
ncbi:MAG: sigma-54-dependent Fis family transcriptional regulator [Labilithrix sp.]|nr:sigma-54-dependent Fis family transcriptional regulator [Labilithrix sp.]